MVDPNIVETYAVGKEGFIVVLCEALGVTEIINQSLSSTNGRPTDIPYGVDAMIMMVNMCHDHRPLSRLSEYYQYTDLEALFHHPITLDKINDDRFGGFLDPFHEAGFKKIFSKVAAKAVSLYRIQVRNINFDTTSKVIWGEYETPESTTGAIEMNLINVRTRNRSNLALVAPMVWLSIPLCYLAIRGFLYPSFKFRDIIVVRDSRLNNNILDFLNNKPVIHICLIVKVQRLHWLYAFKFD